LEPIQNYNNKLFQLKKVGKITISSEGKSYEACPSKGNAQAAKSQRSTVKCFEQSFHFIYKSFKTWRAEFATIYTQTQITTKK
jgi:hypothetical protein